MLNNHSQTDTMLKQNFNINIHINIFACLLFSEKICLLVQQESLMGQCFEGCFSNHEPKNHLWKIA